MFLLDILDIIQIPENNRKSISKPYNVFLNNTRFCCIPYILVVGFHWWSAIAKLPQKYVRCDVQLWYYCNYAKTNSTCHCYINKKNALQLFIKYILIRAYLQINILVDRISIAKFLLLPWNEGFIIHRGLRLWQNIVKTIQCVNVNVL